MKRINGVVLFAFALAASACGAEDVENEVESEVGAKLVYARAFSDGGVLRVVQQDDGFLGFQVTAPIASDASRLATSAADEPSLIGVYKSLFNEQPPEEVVRLSEDVEIQRGLPHGSPPESSRQTVDSLPDADVIDKSSSWFYANLCQNFNVGSGWWQIYSYCMYRNADTSAYSTYTLDSDQWGYDRSYGLNDSSWTATYSLSASAWMPTLAAGSWTWVEWGGSYTGARARLDISPHYGSLGITAHDHTYDP